MFIKKKSNSDGKIFCKKNLYFDSPNQELIIVIKPKEQNIDKNFTKLNIDEAKID